MDDCTQEWTFEENSYDFVHIRWLFGSIMDWVALFKQAYKTLKPGGYIETQEPSIRFESDDGTVNEKTAMGQFGKIFVEGGKRMGRTMTVLEDGIQRKALEEAGFEAIEEANFKVRSTTEVDHFKLLTLHRLPSDPGHMTQSKRRLRGSSSSLLSKIQREQ
jgi:ubiquinone/menaquinone biosynthesis C-methylase UbiE